MVHAVSAFYERSGHMSPVAAALAAGLHVATALALFLVSPLNRPIVDTEDGKPIEVTIEQPKPPETPPEPPPAQQAVKPQPPPPAIQPPAAQPAPPPPPPAAAQKLQPQPPQVSKEPLGITPEAPKADETKAPEARLEPEPQPKSEPKPTQEAAAVAPPTDSAPTPSPEKPLEKVLPPVEQPAAPLTMRDFVKVLPPPPVPPAPALAPQQAPPPQHTAPPKPQPSPLSTGRPQSQASANSGASVSAFVNPADIAARNRLADVYLQGVVRKFTSKWVLYAQNAHEQGTVIVRLAVTRDGRLADLSIAKSSGYTAIDKAVYEAIRDSAPYDPLPSELPGAVVTFTLPIGSVYRR